jgi:hypothetical protein
MEDGAIGELKLSHFPVIYSMCFVTPPLYDALGNSKGEMSQDSTASLQCHCNCAKAISGVGLFLKRGNSQKIELGFGRETLGMT